MIIEELVVGPIMTNCYIVGCEQTRSAIVIDPGDETHKILMKLAQLQLKVKYIVNTHGHFDHVGGNKKMKEATHADILIHPDDAVMLPRISLTAMSFGLTVENSPPADNTIDHGDEIQVGDITFQVIATPGHTLGGISLYTDSVVFVGDTLFSGSIGRTDFPGGDYDTLISTIKRRLFVLPDHVTVYSGHGPATTIKREKQFNPFLR
ncbi:MAG: MBL fold metallo-hydrolase [Desulfobacterales bacterium]|nr:MBL fold metallo-hydrolase [Desulfobacterales bacterium]